MKLLYSLLALVLVLTGACQAAPVVEETGTPAETLPIQTSTPERTPTLETAAPSTAPLTLRIWLPPEFDPDSGTPAGDLLQARLADFTEYRPRVRLDIRVRSLNDPGGMLDALTNASAAAPLALPDLVALPRATMEAAALKGLLVPLDSFSEVMDSDSWYAYARQLGHLQTTPFGIPFAGDALVLIYRPEAIKEPPLDWTSALESEGPLVFPVSDPQAYYPLTLYQAAGGSILDAEGRPTLEASTLATVLNAFHEAENADLLPVWLTQFENDRQAWEAYLDERGPMVITWASRYLSDPAEVWEAALVPTIDGAPFVLADGWVWSLAGHSVEKQALAIELAEFLTDPFFLADWTSAAGYLPPRADALQTWPPGEKQAFVSQVVEHARIVPPGDVLSTLAPLLTQVTIQVLKQQGDPTSLAEEAVERLHNP
jgi:multiple sugar transport system substrate-binding protein